MYLNMKRKIEIKSFLDNELSLLYQNSNIEHLKVIRVLINFDKPITFLKECVVINQDNDNEVTLQCDNVTKNYIKGLIQKFYTKNINDIKSTIIHNWSHYQIDSRKSSLGKYYTPPHLVNLAKEHAKEFLKQYPKAYVLDTCAGCGAFLEGFKEYNIVGRDVDNEAVEILQELGYQHIASDNSLTNSKRDKYSIGVNDKLIIVGNPPYNDTTSKNKRFGTNQKEKQNFDIDAEFKTKDLGMSFLKHYASLNPDSIIVLHPLAYLIKKANFNKLGNFAKNYKLVNAVIFSSKEFGDAIKEHKTQFPVVCAKYAKGEMDYDFIKNFRFNVFSENFTFCIKTIPTIDDYGIRKYPATKDMQKESDIGLYHYNIRDSNSLFTSGNISEHNDKSNCITVNFVSFYQYAYLNCYRRYFSNNYLVGNISPLCNKQLLNNEQFRDFCIMDTIINNQRLRVLQPNNHKSFLNTKFVINDFRRKTTNHKLYSLFVAWIETQQDCRQEFAQYLKPVFDSMLKDVYVNTSK